MGEQEVKMLKQVIGEMKNQNVDTNATIAQLVQQFQAIGQYLGHLEQGVFAISRELNIVKKTNEMVLNMFIESGVYSQEDIDNKFQDEVVAPIMALEEDRRKRIEDAMKAQQASQPVPEPVQEEVETEEDSGDPVLASERNNVIVFGRKQEDA
jgi:hypothetical protein